MKGSPETIRRIGVLANTEKAGCREAVRRAVDRILEADRTPCADGATRDFADLDLEVFPDGSELSRKVDLLLVFGGDGTMLRAARAAAGASAPLLGINLGGLGFLTAAPLEGLDVALRQVWAGEYSEEPRSMIEATTSSGQDGAQIALNDFVVGRGPVPRLIELEVRVDDSILTRYRSDGVIISSPTGSTAYSLAAGGAIVCPNAEVFTVTPICPHTLSNRSVIVNLNAEIQVQVLSPRIETFLSADGQVQVALAPGETVRFRRSRLDVRLVRLAGTSFFETLRQKLNWSGSPV